MAVYFHYLLNQSLDAVCYAVDESINKGERFPVISKLRDYANAYRAPDKRVPVIPRVEIAEFTQDELDRHKGSGSEDIFKNMLKEATERAIVSPLTGRGEKTAVIS